MKTCNRPSRGSTHITGRTIHGALSPGKGRRFGSKSGGNSGRACSGPDSASGGGRWLGSQPTGKGASSPRKDRFPPVFGRARRGKSFGKAGSFVAGGDAFPVGAEDARDAFEQRLRLLRPAAVVLRLVGDERVVLPDGHAVLAPKRRERPAREWFARIPFALAIVEQRAGGKPGSQPLDEFAGEKAFLRRECDEVPLRAVGVIDGNEG